MSPSDPPTSERIERMKQVLADSYPRLSEAHRKEPLPESVRAALEGRPAPSAQPQPQTRRLSLMEQLLGLFRGPRLALVGATAILVIAAILAINPPASEHRTGVAPGTETFRSGDGPVSLPSVVVLHGLTAEQVATLESSGYFRPEQLLAVPANADLVTFLEEHRRPNLVLVDGADGTISAPFAEAETIEPVTFDDAGDDLAPLILDMLARLPEPVVEEENPED